MTASIVTSVSVCLSAPSPITRKPHGQTSAHFMPVVYRRVSAVLWQRCDTSCTSGFVDDVMFSHNGSVARHVYS